jgi:uncharacterized protein (TIGR01777 family)
VVVAGASGLIGRALSDHLHKSGHEVVALVRRPVRPGEPAIQWDPQAGTLDSAGLEGVDAAVNLAGAGIGDRRWSAERKQVLKESRFRSTALLASTLAGLHLPPVVLINASAVGFYGDRGDEVVSEATGPGSDFLASLCERWEDETAPAAEAGIRVALVRSGLVLAAQGGALARMRRIFHLGLGGRLGSGSQWWSWITLSDEVAALDWLLHHDISGPVNLTAPNPVTNREFTHVLARVMSRPAVLVVPPIGPRLLLGAELADSLLFTSTRVQPAVLEGGGFSFEHPELEPALLAVLGDRGGESGQ